MEHLSGRLIFRLQYSLLLSTGAYQTRHDSVRVCLSITRNPLSTNIQPLMQYYNHLAQCIPYMRKVGGAGDTI